MSELNLKRLRFENNLSQEELGKILNITKQQVSKIEKGRARLTSKNFEILNKKYNLNLQNQSQEQKFILIKYYPENIAYCKNNGCELSDNYCEYRVPIDLFKQNYPIENYSMCHAQDNSMYPLIWAGDFVVLEHQKNMNIVNNQIYMFYYENQIYLKKLSKNINQIVVESHNPVFQTQYIEKQEFNNIILIGRVVCSGKFDENFKQNNLNLNYNYQKKLI